MNTYEKYLWLVDVLRRGGELTFEEIAAKWEVSSLNDEHKLLTKRTFLNYINAIETSLGVQIVCDRKNSYRYRIEDEVDNNSIQEWLLNSISVNNTLSESRELSERIMLENIPSGQKHIPVILDAMKCNKAISITHQSYWQESPSMREVLPYGLRLVDKRWYLIAYVYDYDKILPYGLDRIMDIDITDHDFTMPEDFSIKEFFKGCNGVVTGEDIETIRIRVTDNQQRYVDSLPLHESQLMIERNDDDDFAVFEYRVRPTIDFTMKILAYGASIEVLEPIEYRNTIADIASRMMEKYS